MHWLCYILYYIQYTILWGVPSGSADKKSSCNAGDTGDKDLIPGSVRSPGGGNGNLFQYYCQENPKDRGSWWATVHRVSKNQALWSKWAQHRILYYTTLYYSVQFSSVQLLSCVWLFVTPMDCSMPGFPFHHQLPELTQTHVHWVGDAIQPSHPLSSPSSPAFNLSQHQGLFKWVNSSHQVAKGLKFQLQHQSFQYTPRTDLLSL